MKTQIKSQAKSEVGELLSSCVVSPLEEHIQNALHKSEGALSETVNQKAQSAEKHLIGQIGMLSTLLEEKTSELSEGLETGIPEAIEDSREAVQKDISDLAGAADKRLTATSQSINQLIKASAETTVRDIENLNTQLAAHKTQIGSLIQQIDSGFSQLSQATEKKQAEITQEINSRFSELFRNMEQTQVELSQQVEDKLSKLRQAIFQELEQLKSTAQGNIIETGNKIDSLAETLERNQTCVANRQDEIKIELEQYESEAEKRTEKRYKTLLTASLILGFTNFLGIIALALICFL